MVGSGARGAIVAFLAAAFVLAACNSAAPSQPATQIPTPDTTASPAPSVSATATEPAGSGTPAGTCRLDAPNVDWTPLPATSGRCTVPLFDPTISFAASPGWLWGGDPHGWTLTRDNGSTWLGTYRYGGAVVPAYCTDPPPTIPMSKASDVVAWLGTVKDLDVQVTERTVAGVAAWQLDMSTAKIPSCSGDPDKGGLVSLWSIDGEIAALPETMGDHEQRRVYLIELPDRLLVMTARATAEEGANILSYADFLVLADTIFASLKFE